DRRQAGDRRFGGRHVPAGDPEKTLLPPALGPAEPPLGLRHPPCERPHPATPPLAPAHRRAASLPGLGPLRAHPPRQRHRTVAPRRRVEPGPRVLRCAERALVRRRELPLVPALVRERAGLPLRPGLERLHARRAHPPLPDELLHAPDVDLAPVAVRLARREAV